MKIQVNQIIDFLMANGFEFQAFGNTGITVSGFCPLNSPKDNCITWIKKPDADSLARFKGNRCNVIVSPSLLEAPVDEAVFLVTGKPKGVFFSILHEFWGNKTVYGAAPSSVVKGRCAGKVAIGEHCFIGGEVEIGEGTVIEHQVSIYNRVRIGKNCIIHSGAVIGADGFGYYFPNGRMAVKVEHFGGVEIGDDVEIGANVCIDRGTLEDTVIGSHTKIDNLVHIAHNVQVGECACIVAGAAVCGSAVLGDGAYIAPGGIIKNQITVGKDGFAGLGAVVTEPVPDGMVVAGVPARPVRKVKEGDK